MIITPEIIYQKNKSIKPQVTELLQIKFFKDFKNLSLFLIHCIVITNLLHLNILCLL